MATGSPRVLLGPWVADIKGNVGATRGRFPSSSHRGLRKR